MWISQRMSHGCRDPLFEFFRDNVFKAFRLFMHFIP